MKNVFLGLLVSMSVTPAFAAMPFSYSGMELQAIFSSPLVWPKIGGAVESIRFLGHRFLTSTYELQTTEQVPQKGPQGEVIKWVPTACVFQVAVTNRGDEMAPTYVVTRADLSKCGK